MLAPMDQRTQVDPISEGYKRLRRLGEQYVDYLNRRDMTEPETDRYETLCAIIERIEQNLERGEEELARLLGVPCQHHWHPMVPKVDRRKTPASGPMQLTLETGE